MIKIVNDCWIESEELGEVPYPLVEIQDYFSPNIDTKNDLYRRGYKLPKSLQFIEDLYENLVWEELEETDCDISIMYEGEDEDDFESPKRTYIHFFFSYFSISCIQEDNSDSYYWLLRMREDKGAFAIAQDLPRK